MNLLEQCRKIFKNQREKENDMVENLKQSVINVLDKKLLEIASNSSETLTFEISTPGNVEDVTDVYYYESRLFSDRLCFKEKVNVSKMKEMIKEHYEKEGFKVDLPQYTIMISFKEDSKCTY